MKFRKPISLLVLCIAALSLIATTCGIFSKQFVKAYIDSEVESLEEYHIRKIKWAIEELERQGKEITLWNLIETAGVKPKYMKYIVEEVGNLLLEKGYSADILCHK